MKRYYIMLIIIVLYTNIAFAQTINPIVRIRPFTTMSLNTSETAMLERLIASYITELKKFRIIDSKGQTEALDEAELALTLGNTDKSSSALSADYILTGSLDKISDLYILTLENTKVSTGEKLVVSDTADNLRDIILNARALTRSLFSTATATVITNSDNYTPIASTIAEIPAVNPEIDVKVAEPSKILKNPSIAMLIGTWKGDKGFEAIRIFPNGSIIAILSGGGTVRLKIEIQNDDIIITQDQANTALMYKSSSISYEQAVQIAKEARPMKWIFQANTEINILSGKKESIAIGGNGSTIQVDNTYERAATWTRISY